MNSGHKRSLGFYLTLCAILLIPALVIMVSRKAVEFSGFDTVISTYQSGEADPMMGTFPIHRTGISGRDTAISGVVTVNFEGDDPRYIFIPFFEGRIKLFSGDDLYYDSNDDLVDLNAINVGRAVVQLPRPAVDDTLAVSFEVSSNGGVFAQLSRLYVGDRKTVFLAAGKASFFYGTLRQIFWGGELSFIVCLLILRLAKALDHEVVPPFLIISFLILIKSASIFISAEWVIDVQRYTYALSPFCTLGVIFFGRNIYSEATESVGKWLIVAAGLFFVVACLLGMFSIAPISLINLFLSVPIIVLGLLWQFFGSLRNFFREENISSGVYCTALAAFLASIFHDLLARFGLIEFGVVTGIISGSMLFVSIGTVFFAKIARGQVALAKGNARLSEELEKNSRSLIAEFEKSTKLKIDYAASQKVAQLNSELHDGVLTYLSMITSLSEKNADHRIEYIHKLSRYASNEIRIIMESEAETSTSLFLALSAFRRRVVDPLRYLGVEVNWNLLVLQDCAPIEPKNLLNIVRIFQEAVHNATVRAECKVLEVTAAWTGDNVLQISIVNGGGIALRETDKAGMGLENIKRRVDDLSGTFSMRPNDTGAALILQIPGLAAQR
jgi:signal transduction histidine kinase